MGIAYETDNLNAAVNANYNLDDTTFNEWEAKAGINYIIDKLPLVLLLARQAQIC